jgi:rRNA maturation endonuclease Nob1
MDANAETRPQASLTVYRIPRCPKCETSNPEQFQFCKKCGEPAPPITDLQTVTAEVIDG